MLVLGITGGLESRFQSQHLIKRLGHDSASVLMENGEVICAIEEERLTRMKHTNAFCGSAINFCLREGKVKFSDIDAVAIYSSESWLTNFILRHQLNRDVITRHSNIREYYQDLFEKETGVCLPSDKFRFVNHHLSHAACAYYMSGFDDCLILSVDAFGDDLSAMVLDARNGQFTELMTKSESDSLGYFYLDVISFLGYGHFDEYKVMGLAPYGNATIYRALFSTFYTLLPEGDFSVHNHRIIELYNILPPRRAGDPFNETHKNIAAALQEALENIVLHILRHYSASTRHSRLLVTGGVGQNSSMNGKILKSGLFKDFFATSFSGDAGCAYGAAAFITHIETPQLPRKKSIGCFWGTHIGTHDAIAEELSDWAGFLTFRHVNNIDETVASLIAEGYVIGWVQGNSEFGPRSLGNRSIIADPRIGSHKELINSMIKMRESYRPFAPSVLAENVREYFEVPSLDSDFPFMAVVLNVKPRWRETLPAITHVDGTARVQTVHRSTNSKYWKLIKAFEKISGIPILLNTSFNNNFEPIVDSVKDAMVCFITSKLDFLVVGDFLVERKPDYIKMDKLLDCRISLSASARLISENMPTKEGPRATSYWIERNDGFSKRASISPECFAVLERSGSEESLRDCLARVTSQSSAEGLVHEIYEWWEKRIIDVQPIRMNHQNRINNAISIATRI